MSIQGHKPGKTLYRPQRDPPANPYQRWYLIPTQLRNIGGSEIVQSVRTLLFFRRCPEVGRRPENLLFCWPALRPFKRPTIDLNFLLIPVYRKAEISHLEASATVYRYIYDTLAPSALLTLSVRPSFDAKIGQRVGILDVLYEGIA